MSAGEVSSGDPNAFAIVDSKLYFVSSAMLKDRLNDPLTLKWAEREYARFNKKK